MNRHIDKRAALRRQEMLSEREETVKECIGCKRVEKSNVCEAYLIPETRWKLGDCLLASHLRVIETGPEKYKPGKFGKRRRTFT